MIRLGVTGANGFIGQGLRKHATASGWELVGVARPGKHSGRAPSKSIRTIEDPWSPEAWGKALTGVDVVVHLISRAHHVHEEAGAYGDYYRDNVMVSEALMEGLVATSAKKVVYLSSIKAVGEQTLGTPIDGSSIPAPTTLYGRSKLEAEQRFERWATDESRSLVVLRPPLVYGPEVKGNFRSLLRIADSGVPLPIAGITNKRSMIFLDNLNDAILASASDDVIGIHRLPIADSEVLSTPDVVEVLRASLGRPMRLFGLSKRILAAAARAASMEERFRRISHDLVVDSREAMEELGWTPRKTTIEGLIETARWYRESGR